MDRYEKISRRVVATEAVAVSFFRQAKDRPTDIFGASFFDIREKVKKLKQDWEDEALGKIQATLQRDLKGRGVQTTDLKISLGQYRGSRFVTSAKFSAKAKNKKQAEALLRYLQNKYSPKYKLKSFDEKSGIATYNVR